MANSAFNHEPAFTIPGSTTDNAVIRWDGTSGTGQLNSGILIDDSNVITGVTSLTVDNLLIDGNTISSTAGTDLFITPLAGQQLILDGTIIIDAGVVTAATSITSTQFVGGGVGLTALNADNIGSGTVPVARLGDGNESSSTFLRGDNAWVAVTGTTINTNADNRVMTGSGTANTLNGEANLLYNGAILFVSDDANGAMSIGLTIQQNHYDNEAFCVKSNDIAHGISGTETDSYFTVQKANPGVGGAMLTGYAETGDYAGIQLRTYVIDANGTKTASGVGSLNVTGYHGTDGGPLNDSGNANMVVFRAGNTHTRHIFDVEGDIYYDGSSNSYDGYADAELTRALSHTMQAATSKPSTIIHNKWDDFVEYNEQDLIDAGILGGPVVGVDYSERGLVNLTQLQRLHNGAIWQLHSRLSDQAEEITALKGQLTALVGAVKE